jgi:hypothetical protein
LTDDELKEIVLFFDKNRNGVSEGGELMSASVAGLRMLSVKSDFKDPVTGDVVANTGFERVDEGTVRVGKAVDWYAKAYASKQEALDSLALNVAQAPAPTDRLGDTTGAEDSAAAGKKGVLDAPSDEELAKFDDTLSGVWRWRVDGKPSTGGLFIFASTNGVAPGASISEIPIVRTASGSSEATETILMSRFIATIAEHKGRRGVIFEVKNGVRRAMSVAALGADGVLRGETTQRVSNGDTIQYSWSATKVVR